MSMRVGGKIAPDFRTSWVTKGLLFLLIDTLPLLIAYLDRVQRFHLNKKANENWFGQPCEQLLGRHVRQILGEYAYQIIKPQILAALNGESATVGHYIAFRYASSRDVEVSCTPHIDQREGVLRLFVLINDLATHERRWCKTDSSSCGDQDPPR